jgi:hypothetical protein
MRLLSTIVVAALCATHAVNARTHRRAPKRTAAATVAAPKVTPSEAALDPAKVALVRRIKSIGKGC